MLAPPRIVSAAFHPTLIVGGRGDGGWGGGDGGGGGLGGGGNGEGGGGGGGGLGGGGNGEGGGGGGDGDGGGDGGAGGRMYEIVMAFPSDSAGWPPLLPTYPWRSQQGDDARQKIQPPSPSRITINQSVRIQQPDEAS